MLRFLRYNIIRLPERFPGRRNVNRTFRFRNFYVIAPYWAKISHDAFKIAGKNASMVYYHVYRKDAISTNREKEIFNRANSDVQRYQTNPRIPLFEASWILVVTWVRIYPNTYPTVTAVGLSFNCYNPCHILLKRSLKLFKVLNYMLQP